jgi:starch synthase
MPPSLKILSLSAEVDPFAKKGGLADVAGSLPKALRALGHDVRVVMPAYQNVEDSVRAGRDELTPTTRRMPIQLNVPMGSGPLPAG